MALVIVLRLLSLLTGRGLGTLLLLPGAHLRGYGHVPGLFDRRQLPPFRRYARHRCVRQLRLKELDARLQIRRLLQGLTGLSRKHEIRGFRTLLLEVVVLSSFAILTITVTAIITTIRYPRGIHVTRKGIPGLTAALVQDAQVRPGGLVCLVQLYGANVGLQRVHRLVLLLVKHSDRAPRVRVPLALLHRVAVRYERIVHLVQARVAPPQQVQWLP